ncbi:MAG TPA: glycoside hydrolase family 43 protein [Vicinamibacterales bacterium]
MSDTRKVVYLFSYFTGEGADGLRLATSENGLTWQEVDGGLPLLPPGPGSGVMRDPHLSFGPDGVFRLVWTTGWWDKGFGYAESCDLRAWSTPRFVPVMAHEPEARNTWAPEIVYDRSASHYLIFWATTIPGRFPETDLSGDLHDGRQLNHRLYCTTTTDFEHFAPASLFYDGGFNVIDGTIVDLGDRFAMIVKDETRAPIPHKHLRVTFAPAPRGPWGPAGRAFTPGWVEGPSVVRLGDAWVVYYDEYTRQRYGAMRTHDFETWEDVSGLVRMPAGARHGTVLDLPPDAVAALQAR